MSKLAIDGWSLLEVEMNEKNNSFKVLRRLTRADLALPGINPTFVFYTSYRSTILVNNKGIFLLRYKYPKGCPKPKNRNDIPSAAIPKLFKPPDNHKRLAKKAVKQLFASGKITRG